MKKFQTSLSKNTENLKDIISMLSTKKKLVNTQTFHRAETLVINSIETAKNKQSNYKQNSLMNTVVKSVNKTLTTQPYSI